MLSGYVFQGFQKYHFVTFVEKFWWYHVRPVLSAVRKNHPRIINFKLIQIYPLDFLYSVNRAKNLSKHDIQQFLLLIFSNSER